MITAPKKKKKKKKKPNPVIDYLIYLLMRTVSMFMQISDVDASVRFARSLGAGLYVIYRRGRKRAIDQLRESYPDKDDAWLEATAKASMEHIAMLAFDVMRHDRLLRGSTWHKYIELDDMSEALSVILKHKSIIMVTGHYGNFEALGVAMGIFGLEGYSIARPIDNPYINDYLVKVRQRKGQTIIDKKGATDNMHAILESGNMLGFIADQNAGRKGIFVDFFGRKASTYKSIGLLAMHYNLPIVVGYCRRIDNRYKFKVGISRIIQPQDWQDQDNPLHWVTAEYTTAIENFIREAPEQYWWIHRRWKTRPPEERKAASKELSSEKNKK